MSELKKNKINFIDELIWCTYFLIFEGNNPRCTIKYISEQDKFGVPTVSEIQKKRKIQNDILSIYER